MKYILLLIFIPLLNFGQSNNFIVTENKNINWINVFNDTISPANFVTALQTTGKFERIEIINNKVEFTFTFNRQDLKLHGYKVLSDPTFIGLGGTCKGFAEFKDNKYRVTLHTIDVNNNTYNSESQSPLNTYLLKNDATLRDGDKYIRALNYFNSFFTNLFTIKIKTDW